MFVRILSTEDGKKRSQTFQCEGVDVLENGDSVKVQMRGDGVAPFPLVVDKSNAIYVMNDSGKTIDTYKWNV